jgi:hypothetical protein
MVAMGSPHRGGTCQIVPRTATFAEPPCVACACNASSTSAARPKLLLWGEFLSPGFGSRPGLILSRTVLALSLLYRPRRTRAAGALDRLHSKVISL